MLELSDKTRLQKIAEDMISFKEETIKLCQRKGQLFRADDLQLTNANEETIIETSSLKGIPGVTFFAMGPVYISAGVPYSFLDQFSFEVDKDIQFLTFDLGAKVFDGLDVVDPSTGKAVGTWNDKLHAVGTEHFPKVKAFMESQVLARNNIIHGIATKEMVIQDPVLKFNGKATPTDIMRLSVFYTYTSRTVLEPVIDYRSGRIIRSQQPPSQRQVDVLNAVAKVRAKSVI